MKYTKYNYFADSLLKAINKQAGRSKNDSYRLDEATKLVIENDPGYLIKEINGFFVCHEWHWQSSKRTIVFPENSAVLDGIASGKFEITYPEGITPFTDSFILNFPKDYSLASQKATSVLVTYCKGPVTVNKYITPLLAHLSLAGIEEYVVEDEHQKSASMRLFYRRFDQKEGAYANHMLLVPWNHLAEILKSKNVEQYQDKLENIGESLSVSLSPKESEYEFALLKMVVSFLVYVQANKHLLIKGFPGQIRPNVNGSHVKLPDVNDLTLKNPVSRKPATGSSDNNTSAHYRTWHFRQLVDDRYYKGEWEDRPKGSRIVFVSDAYVNNDVDARTVVKS